NQLLDRVVWAMLLVALVAFWPRHLLPGPWRRGAPRPAASPAPSAASPSSPPPPSTGPGAVASDPVDLPSPTGGHDPGTGGRDPGKGGREVGTGGREVVVECRGLARHYGGVRALDGLDLRIHEGELVGLVGPNGSGKTTLVNLLSGAARPTSGTIHIRGRDTAGLAPHTFAHAGIARTYQIPRPFESMTLRDNVAVAVMFGRERHGLAEARRRATAHLEFVGLGELADARPGDVNLHQRQLLEMARALATSPQVLLLDEALAGLNPAEIDNAVEVVRRIHATGVTIVILEHLLRVVTQLAQRIVVLDRGRLLADGDPDTVMRHPAVVSAYLGRSGRTAQAGDSADAAAGEREGTHA